MLKFSQNQDKLEFCMSKIEYTENGIVHTLYTDNPSLYQRLINQDPAKSNYTLASLIPTEEQQARLEVLNKLDIYNHPQYINDFQLFVETGAIVSDQNFFDEIRATYRKEGQEYVNNKIKDVVKSIRKSVLDQGYEYEGNLIELDKESQSSINNILTLLNNKVITKTNYKTGTGFITLDKDQFTKLANVVNKYVQACYTAEEALVDEISKLDIRESYKLTTELTKIDGKEVYYKTLKDKFKVYVDKIFNKGE